MKHDILITGKNIILTLLVVTLLMSCGDPFWESKERRAEIAREGEGDVVVAVVWPRLKASDLFLKGIDLAVEQINKKGGVLGRRLRTIFFKDIDKPGEKFNAEKIAGNSEIVTVMGHYDSGSALSASITYEYNGILFLVTNATNPLLLDQGFAYVFRTIPNDRIYGEHLAHYTFRKGYKRIIIVDDNTFYGKGLADIFHENATDLGLHIVTRKGYFPWQDNFRPLIAEIDKLKFDAVFLGGNVPRAARVVKQFRQMDVTAPFIAGDGLDSQDLITIAGQAAEGTVVPTVFNPHSSDPVFLSFMDRFRTKYKRDPDVLAAQGYDAIKLLAFVMTKSGSTVPLIVASILRHTRNWKGVLGSYSFVQNGELSERRIFFKQVRDGRFVYLKE